MFGIAASFAAPDVVFGQDVEPPEQHLTDPLETALQKSPSIMATSLPRGNNTSRYGVWCLQTWLIEDTYLEQDGRRHHDHRVSFERNRSIRGTSWQNNHAALSRAQLRNCWDSRPATAWWVTESIRQ
ncbi:hypothetical protein J2S43_002964 [Catenuloplanes nepalensis]|uniref:Uncharacterized protein n=1 Tax=Catenuloplanes nepalensis TaxID=587533 RepID=A0ABT9MSN9_9ACTN|nr:hypothetical protein [Catenuloplanes nepalensis]